MLSFCTFNQPTCSEAWVKVGNTPKVGMATLELPTVAQTSFLHRSHLLLRTGQELVLLSQNSEFSCSPTNFTLAELLLLAEPPVPGTSQKCILWEAVAAPV